MCFSFRNLKNYSCCENDSRRPLTCPGSIDLKDLHGDVHRLEVKVLGTEETWNTPSLILATDTNCNGIAVFSQVKNSQNLPLILHSLRNSLESKSLTFLGAPRS